MIKLFIFFSALVFSSISFADDGPVPAPIPQPIDVEMYAHLEVKKECLVPRDARDTIICDAVMSVPIGSVKIRLYPKNRIFCIPRYGVCDNSDTSYRGLWSAVVEKDAYRAIAIISIDRKTYQYGNESVTTFTVKVEIIDEQGVAGKMVTSVHSLTDLSSTSLYGHQVTNSGEKYTPIITIDKPRVLCPIGNACNNYYNYYTNKMNNWNVELGTIHE
ncbi:MAG: hypothetical protein A2X86_08270 [Bdellovibrionales bacterium GWA2_49_15]|nr:MAG: hypothetical protein A2X86_08270 [Bdellovibrionales bacterium GWA2_49_15]HAZ11244.1 hypothetical protein [Bdellovibrionales bacterium]